MGAHYREAEMKHHRGDGEHGEGDGNAPRDAYMHRIREIEEAMRSGKSASSAADCDRCQLAEVILTAEVFGCVRFQSNRAA